MRRLVSVGLAVLATAGCGTSSGPPAGSAGPATTETTAAASNDEPRFIPQSVSFVSSDRGWAFGPAEWPSEHSVTAGVLAVTHDGGATWHLAPATGVTYSMTSDGARAVRFLDERHGYLYGGSTYFTSDAGEHWTAVAGPDILVDLQPLGDDVIALGCDGPADCRTPDVYLADGAGQSFRRVGGVTGADPRLAVSTTHAYIWTAPEQDVGRARVWRSDDGRSWIPQPAPCEGGWADAGALTTFGESGVALVCGAPPSAGQQLKDAYVSTDRGLHWTERGRLTQTSGYVGVLAAADADTWILGLYRGGLLTTHDAGRTWVDAAAFSAGGEGVEGFGQVQFIGPRQAVAVPWTLNGDLIARTDDGGDTWTVTRFRPADAATTPIVINQDADEVLTPDPDASPRLTAAEAWTAYTSAAGHPQQQVPDRLDVVLGRLTLPPQYDDRLVWAYGYGPVGCLNTLPQATPMAGTEWTFLDADTGDAIETTCQPSAG